MKKFMHKSLSIILVMTLVLSLFSGLSFSSSAADLPSSGSCGTNVTYTFDSSTGTLTISGTGAMTNYSWTFSSIDGFGSTSPFYNRTIIKNVIIKNGVTSIGSYAFEDCSDLTSVTIPNSVTSIGERAFSGCSGLTSITIPNSVTSISSYAFAGCSGLTSITIPNSVTSISSYAFAGCSGLTSVNIPDSVTSIGENAFSACRGLTSVTIPNSVTSISSYAFSGCSGLTSITIPNSVTSIGSGAFSRCSGLTNITIPNSVTSIGSYAFQNCSGLTSVTIPNSVTNISDYAFQNCRVLTSVTIPDSVTRIGDYAFQYCSGLTSITIPNSVTSIGSNAFYDCRGLTSVTIPDSVTSIGSSAFSGCSGLTSVTIGNSVTSIDRGAFSSCISVTKITVNENNKVYDSRNNCNAIVETETNTLIQGCNNTIILDSVTSIGSSAFSGCSGLTSITIPDSVTSIGSSAFSGCSGLTSITIPDSVTSIGHRAFYGCSGLTSIIIPNSVTSIGDSAFYNCIGLKELTMPVFFQMYTTTFSGCTSIEKVTLTKGAGTGAMQDYSSSNKYMPWYQSRYRLKEIVIEDGISNIGNYAFYNCSGLTSIKIPDSVTSIGVNAFYNTGIYNNSSNWKNGLLYIDNWLIKATSGINGDVIVDNGIIGIGSSAFSGCSGLTSVTIPDSVKSIGEYAFNSCNSLKKVNISSLEAWCQILFTSHNNPLEYAHALYLNDELITDVTIPSKIKDVPNYVFYGCRSIKNLTIPNTIISIGDYSFYGCTDIVSLIIPESVEEIGECAFSFTKLSNISVNENNRVFDSRNNCNAVINRDTDELVVGCKNTAIPNSVKSIGDNAFRGCTGLISIEIPQSVTSIGMKAFHYCTGLKDIVIPESVTNISDSAFVSCSGLSSINIKGESCNVFDSSDTIPANTTIIINGSKNVYEYAVKYNRNFICNHVEITDEAKVPTCLETGLTQGKHCNICGEVLIKQENVNSLGHTPAEPVRENEVAPTCTKTGSYYEVVYCSVCGEQISREKKTISKLPHTPAESVRENEIAPTCAKTGSYDEVVYCSVCKQEISRQKKTITKLPHTPANEPVRRNEVAPTCTKDGFYDDVIYCTVCKQELSRQTKPIKKLGHDLKVVETIAPTYTEQGYDILQCQRAGCDHFEYANYVPETLASISVSLKEPISLLERADATRYDRTDLAAMHQYGEFYYEYEYSIFKPGNAITLTATNGTKEVFTYSEDTGEFVNAKGEGIYPEVTDTQSEITPWTVGTNYFTVSYGNKSVNVPVTIRKNPIVQIVFIPNNPYIYTQYAEGEWDTYRASEFDAPVRYFRYDLPTFKTGDRLAVSYDDGVLQYNTDYTYDETKKAFVSATGESIPDSEVKCGYSGGNCLDWTIGERGGWFEFAYLGCTSYAAVKIRENYVQSIAFTPVKPYEVIEGNSKEHFVKWDEKTETYIEGDYYDAFDIYVPGNKLTVNYKNGSSDTFICKQTSEGLVFANAGGETISPKSVSNQYQKPWTLGSNNTFTVKWSGAQVSVPVTMVESPISDIAYNPAKPIVLVENTGGYYRDNDLYHGKVFFYDNPLFKEGDELLLYYKTGATKKYTAKFVNGKVDFYDSVGNPLEGILWVDDNYQYEFPWQLGDYNNCIVKYMGQSASVLVSVVKKHTYVAKKTAATAVNVGFTEYICSDCGEYKLDAKGAVYKDNFTAPTGKVSGFKCASKTATAEKFTWTKTAGVNGYQIQLLTSAGKSAGLKALTANSYTFSKLAAGHAYKARVRFYITKDGKNYYGAWTTINSPTLPAGSAISKLTPAKKAFTAQWKKGACTGYQLQYATNAKFTKAAAKTVKGAAKVKLAVKSLKAGTKYFVRVRTYKTIGGKNYYSAWSGAKAVTTKK